MEFVPDGAAALARQERMRLVNITVEELAITRARVTSLTAELATLDRKLDESSLAAEVAESQDAITQAATKEASRREEEELSAKVMAAREERRRLEVSVSEFASKLTHDLHKVDALVQAQQQRVGSPSGEAQALAAWEVLDNRCVASQTRIERSLQELTNFTAPPT